MRSALFTLLAFLSLTTKGFAQELVIISDLDETLKQAAVENKVRAGIKLIEGVRPYLGMQIIFNELKAKHPGAKFYYLSNSYTFLYSGKEWTRKFGFPQGVVLQRSIKDQSDSFKPSKLKEIIKNHPNAKKWLLFGDNVEKDPKFYEELVSESGLNNSEIYIRDARLIFPQSPLSNYYQHEVQILDALRISQGSAEVIRSLPFNELVPKFLLKTLRKRLVKECKLPVDVCKEEARERVSEVRDLLQVQD